jgi:uncharacterized protein YdhG (YjbR/CyaY superfamily)
VKLASVEAYLAAQPEPARAVLNQVRAIIRAALPPEAEEAISYSIPAFKLNGRVIIYFAAWKHHYSLYPLTSAIKAAFTESELSPYPMSKGTIRFPLNEPIPTALIEKITKVLAQTHQKGSKLKS